MLAEDENRQYVSELRQRVARGAVVPFVGAGLSVPFDYPGWSEVLRGQAQAAGLHLEVAALVAGGKFEEAASLLHEHLGAGFSSQLRLTFGPARLEGRDIDGAPQILAKIFGGGPVVTSNYDEVLQRAYTQQGHPFARIVRPPDEELLSEAFSGNCHYLLHIHGRWDEASSRILTLSQYESYYGGDSAASFDISRGLPQALHLMFLSRSVLFLGCSLNEDRYLQVLVKLLAEGWRVPLHFAVLERPKTEQLRYARRNKLLRWNIMPIFFPSGRYDLIPEILERLGPDAQPRTSQRPRDRLAPRQSRARADAAELLDDSDRTSIAALTGVVRSPRAEQTRPLVITVLDSASGRKAEHTFHSSPISIGRDPQSDLRLPFPFVSRRHARVYFDGAKTTVLDDGSTAGMLIDGRRIPAGEATAVGETASVAIGTLMLHIERIDGAAQPASAPPPPLEPSSVTRSGHASKGAPPVLRPEPVPNAAGSPPERERSDDELHPLRDRGSEPEAPPVLEPPPGLVAAIAEGRSVLLAGAGASFDAGLPSWSTLVRELVDAAASDGSLESDTVQALHERVEHGEGNEVVEVCRRHLSEARVEDFLRLRLSAQGRYSPTHRALAGIPFRAALSTNLDDLVERAHPGCEVLLPPDLARLGADGAATLLARRDRFVVIKMHGSLDVPGSMLVDDEDYARWWADPGYRGFILHVMSSFSVFLYGYQPPDPPIDHWLHEAGQAMGGEGPPHYAFLWEHDPARLAAMRRSYGLRGITDPGGMTPRKALVFLERLRRAVQ